MTEEQKLVTEASCSVHKSGLNTISNGSADIDFDIHSSSGMKMPIGAFLSNERSFSGLLD